MLGAAARQWLAIRALCTEWLLDWRRRTRAPSSACGTSRVMHLFAKMLGYAASWSSHLLVLMASTSSWSISCKLYIQTSPPPPARIYGVSNLLSTAMGESCEDQMVLLPPLKLLLSPCNLCVIITQSRLQSVPHTKWSLQLAVCQKPLLKPQTPPLQASSCFWSQLLIIRAAVWWSQF